MIIIWSDEARKTYDSTIDIILLKWNVEVAIVFEEKTNALLDHLKIYKKFCPASKIKKLRKCVIHKNTSLIYKINQKNIELVAFIDNHAKHLF